MVSASAASADFSRYSKPPPLGGGAFTEVKATKVVGKVVGTMSETTARTARGADLALVVEDFVPPDVTSETVGLPTTWPPPIYHDRPSLPLMIIGALCTVKPCKPTVSR